MTVLLLLQELNEKAHSALGAVLEENSQLAAQYRSLAQSHDEENQTVATAFAQTATRYRKIHVVSFKCNSTRYRTLRC